MGKHQGVPTANLALPSGRTKHMPGAARVISFRNSDVSHLTPAQRRSCSFGTFTSDSPDIAGSLLKVRLNYLAHNAFNKLCVLRCDVHHGEACDQRFCGPVRVKECNVNNSETAPSF